MISKANSVDAYIDLLLDDQKTAIKAIRQQLLNNLPKGFEEGMSYGMIGYYIPHSLYPDGYHADPKQPLPFISLAAQKNFIALYHISISDHPELLDYFVSQYPKYCKTKLDMGKSCIRFKKINEIPYQLIGEIAQKISPQDRITQYECQLAAAKTA